MAEQFLPSAIPGYDEEGRPGMRTSATARDLLTNAGFPDGFEIKLTYRERGPRLPAAARGGGRRTCRRSWPRSASTSRSTRWSRARSSTRTTRARFRCTSSAGAPTIRTPPTSWTTTSDPRPGPVRQPVRRHHRPAHAGGGAPTRPRATPLYAQVADLLQQHAPMIPVAHGGSVWPSRPTCDRGAGQPAVQRDLLGDGPGGQDTFVWMQNAEPIGLYCADETRR